MMAAQMELRSINRSASCRITELPLLMEELALEDAVDKKPKGAPKKLCLCSPTTHAGSFRCRFHRATAANINSLASSENSSHCNGSFAIRNWAQVGGSHGSQPRLSRFSGEAAAAAAKG